MISLASLSYMGRMPKYYDRLLASTDKQLAHSHNFINHIRSQRKTSRRNCKGIPANATVKEEQIKCGKPFCLRCPHGPYYYAYWREKGKVRKKYIGTNYEEKWEKSKRSEELLARRLLTADSINRCSSTD